MTDEGLPDSVSDVVAAKVRALRKVHKWQVADLASRSSLSENVIENIEHGRRKDGKRTRQITVDELFELARALEVGVVDLLPGLQRGERLGALDADALAALIEQLSLFQSLHDQGLDHGAR
jgi:transcriptional regulator with XRE-family HTH domain